MRLIAFLLTGAILAIAAQATSSAQGTVTVGIDAVTEGNAANSLGPTESCRRVEPGETFNVDVITMGVNDLAGYGIIMHYDPKVLNVIGVDSNFFLGPGGLSVGGSADTSGRWQFAYAKADGVSGKGVFARVSLKAVGNGTTTLDLPVGPVDTELSDSLGQAIPITSVLPAVINVGTDCAPDSVHITPVPVPTESPVVTATPVASVSPTPGPTTTTPQASRSPSATPGPSRTSISSQQDGGGGFPLWAVGVILVGVAVVGAGGLFVVLRLRGREDRTDD